MRLKQDKIRTHLIGTLKKEHFYVFNFFFFSFSIKNLIGKRLLPSI